MCKRVMCVAVSLTAIGCITEEACLGWMCTVESNDGFFGCGEDFGVGVNCSRNCNGRGNVDIMDPLTETCYCGVYQISQEYFDQCNDPANNYTVPINDLIKCSGNVNCAITCVRNYIMVCKSIPSTRKFAMA